MLKVHAQHYGFIFHTRMQIKALACWICLKICSAAQVGMARGSRMLLGSPSRQATRSVTDHLSIGFTTHQAKMPPMTESNYTLNLVVSENKGISLFASSYAKYRLPRCVFLSFSVVFLSTLTHQFLC